MLSRSRTEVSQPDQPEPSGAGQTVYQWHRRLVGGWHLAGDPARAADPQVDADAAVPLCALAEHPLAGLAGKHRLPIAAW